VRLSSAHGDGRSRCFAIAQVRKVGDRTAQAVVRRVDRCTGWRLPCRRCPLACPTRQHIKRLRSPARVPRIVSRKYTWEDLHDTPWGGGWRRVGGLAMPGARETTAVPVPPRGSPKRVRDRTRVAIVLRRCHVKTHLRFSSRLQSCVHRCCVFRCSASRKLAILVHGLHASTRLPVGTPTGLPTYRR
jgi:hypothetical protein